MNKCPVCGYADLREPAYNGSGSPSFEICYSCGTEFGTDDLFASHKTLRQQCISNGMKWHSSRRRPPANWDPVQQSQSVASDPPAPRRKADGSWVWRDGDAPTTTVIADPGNASLP